MEHADAASVEVLLFGELLADQFPDGDRIGGAPLNVARHLQAFGARPRLLSRIGADDLGHSLLQHLRDWDLDAGGIQRDAQHPTGRVQVHLAKGGHRFEILPDQAYDHIEAGIALKDAQAINPALLYFGTLAQRCASSRQALHALVEKLKIPRFLDLNLRPPWFDRGIIEASLAAADILKLNGQELTELGTLLNVNADSRPEQAAHFITRFSLDAILVTEGAEGAWMLDAGGTLIRADANRPVAASAEGDSVGAGDAFSAVFILGLTRDWPVETSLARANDFAGAICGVRGAVPLDDSFYRPYLNDWEHTPAT